MDYAVLESYIYEINTSVYDVLASLHQTYRYKLYGIIAEKRGLQPDCDLRELAQNVCTMVPKIKADVRDGFEIASMSYAELTESQRRLNKRHGRKADRARINIRKLLGITRDDDTVQTAYDADKRERYESLKYAGFSVQDSIEKKRKNAKSRDWSIAKALDCSMRMAGMTQNPCDSGWFLTLTLPALARGKSFESCSADINDRLNSIKRDAERAGIVWTGTYAIEMHKDETPHIHIAYYVNDEIQTHGHTDRDRLLDIVFKFFKNEDRENDEVNQRIGESTGLLRYIFKDHGKPNTRHGFIGLRRDIKSVWNSLYRGNYGDKRGGPHFSDRCLSYNPT